GEPFTYVFASRGGTAWTGPPPTVTPTRDMVIRVQWAGSAYRSGQGYIGWTPDVDGATLIGDPPVLEAFSQSGGRHEPIPAAVAHYRVTAGVPFTPRFGTEYAGTIFNQYDSLRIDIHEVR
ncbi:MAG: hypothetical protein AAFQ53_07505, partial [Bacteroidota bacterium]